MQPGTGILVRDAQGKFLEHGAPAQTKIVAQTSPSGPLSGKDARFTREKDQCLSKTNSPIDIGDGQSSR
jgi:hypothetical protein